MPLSISVNYRRPACSSRSRRSESGERSRIATLVLVPAFWSMLAGLVAVAPDEDAEPRPNAAAAIALGLALIPFVFIVLAFLSEHPRAPMARGEGDGTVPARRDPGLGARGRRGDRPRRRRRRGRDRCPRAPTTSTLGGPVPSACSSRASTRSSSSEPRARSRCSRADLPVHEHRHRRPPLGAKTRAPAIRE